MSARGTQRERAVRDCECGCGQPAPLARTTDKTRGYVKGQPMRFVSGHNGALSPAHFKREDRGYSSPCWIWQRSTDRNGYGQLTRKGKRIKAHRYVRELVYGPIPDGLELDHLCDTPLCVNPDHLEPVTRRAHVRRHAALLDDRQRAEIRAEADRLTREARARGRKQRPNNWAVPLAEKFGVPIYVVKRAAFGAG